MTGPIICRNCQAENPPGSAFCVQCSFSLDWESDTKDEAAAAADTVATQKIERTEPVAATAEAVPVSRDRQPTRTVAPRAGGRRGWIAAAIIVVIALAIVLAVILTTRGRGDSNSGAGDATGDVAGTVVSSSGVNVRSEPRGTKVGHLPNGQEIAASCQREVDGLFWLKLAAPPEQEGRWIVRDLRPSNQGGIVVELAGVEPADC
jgi:hypothetical protein